MKEKFHAIFKGPKSACFAQVEIEDGKLYYYEKNKLLPFLSKRRHIGGNLSDKLKHFEKRPNYNISTGEKTNHIRFFPFSLEDFKDDFTQIDQDIMQELESKKVECDYYMRMVASLMAIAEEQGMKDIVMKRMVDDGEFLNRLRPPFVQVDRSNKKKK